MTILDLIQKELKTSKYDGLFNSDGECACFGDCPCGELSQECEFGYLQELDDDEKEEFLYKIGRQPNEKLNKIVEEYNQNITFKLKLNGILLDAKVPLELSFKEQILRLSAEQIDLLVKDKT